MKIFGDRKERKVLVFPEVKSLLFFLPRFAFKLVTCLCLPTVHSKVEIDFQEEALRNRLNKIPGCYRIQEEHDIPPSLLTFDLKQSVPS